MSSNQFPSSLEFSDVKFDSISQAESVGAKGKAGLTPYVETSGLKHLNLTVENYDGSKSLLLDTSTLFYGCHTGQTVSAYPNKSATIGDVGAPLAALPISFKRVHFVGSQGKSKDPDNPPKEFYAYFLCSDPFYVNPANITGETINTYPLEETGGTREFWGNETETYAERLVIGGGYTGEVIKDIQFYDSGCFTYAKTKKAIAYLRSEDQYYSSTGIVGYNSGTIKTELCKITSKMDIVEDLFIELQACACAGTPLDTGGSPIPGGKGDEFARCICAIDLSDLTGLPGEFTGICITC